MIYEWMNNLCFIQETDERNRDSVNAQTKQTDRTMHNDRSRPVRANPQLIKEKAITSVTLFASL